MSNPMIQIDDEVREMTDEELATYNLEMSEANGSPTSEAPSE